MEGLFYLFTLGVIISGIMVISALNPVHSVLWLIVAFTSASALFILLEVEFIALIFLIVYVGAIAILFLFVIMMLNLTDLEGGGDMSNYLPAGFIIGVVFLFEIAHVMGGRMVSWPHSTSYPAHDYIIKNPNVEVLGRVLYTDYYYLFIIASFILLVAMIGAIVLTHDTTISEDRVQDILKTEITTSEDRAPDIIKRQDIFIQTSRQLWQD